MGQFTFGKGASGQRQLVTNCRWPQGYRTAVPCHGHLATFRTPCRICRVMAGRALSWRRLSAWVRHFGRQKCGIMARVKAAGNRSDPDIRRGLCRRILAKARSGWYAARSQQERLPKQFVHTRHQHDAGGKRRRIMADKNQESGSGSKSGGTQGGTPEQHAEAGRQSHKNDDQSSSSGSGSKSGGSKSDSSSSGSSNSGSGNSGSGSSGSGSSGSGSKSGGTQGGSSEQHAEAGRQSHKNDDSSSSSKSGGSSKSS